jgi:hypothetical protein
MSWQVFICYVRVCSRCWTPSPFFSAPELLVFVYFFVPAFLLMLLWWLADPELGCELAEHIYEKRLNQSRITK